MVMVEGKGKWKAKGKLSVIRSILTRGEKAMGFGGLMQDEIPSCSGFGCQAQQP